MSQSDDSTVLCGRADPVIDPIDEEITTTSMLTVFERLGSSLIQTEGGEKMQYVLSPSIPTTVWDEFENHCKAVIALSLTDDLRLSDLAWIHLARRPQLFFRLRLLQVHDATSSLSHLPIFCSPSLEDVEIVEPCLDKGANNSIEAFLHIDDFPSLTRLTLDSMILSTTLLDALKKFAGLRSLKLRNIAGGLLIIGLFPTSLPRLKVFEVSCQSQEADPGVDETVFVKVEGQGTLDIVDISISGPPSVIWHLINTTLPSCVPVRLELICLSPFVSKNHTPSQRKGYVKCPLSPTCHCLISLFAKISNMQSLNSLQTFILKVEKSSHISSKVYNFTSRLRQLSCLEVWDGTFSAFQEGITSSPPSSGVWDNLRSLRLPLSKNSEFTCSSLAALAFFCPNLETLHCLISHMNLADPQALNATHGTTHSAKHSLRRLSTGSLMDYKSSLKWPSLKETCAAVDNLTTIFPNLENIETNGGFSRHWWDDIAALLALIRKKLAHTSSTFQSESTQYIKSNSGRESVRVSEAEISNVASEAET